MPTFQDILLKLNDQPLKWKQVSLFSGKHLLLAGETQIASLHIAKIGGSLAEGMIDNSVWTFKRVGFWKPFVTIRQPDTGEIDIAQFPIDWRRGTLTFRDGVSFVWQQKGFFGSEWTFSDPTTNQVLLRFLPTGVFTTHNLHIHIPPEATSRPQLPLLLLFGWYLIVMAQMEDTAVVTTIAASTAVM